MKACTHTVLLLCRKCTAFTFWLKPSCDKLTVVSIGLSDLLPESVCVFVCRKVWKTEKIRMKKEEDGKGQEGDRMKERVEEERETGVAMMREKGERECERTEERVEKGRKKTVGERRKLSHIALMSSGKEMGHSGYTHTHTHADSHAAVQRT